MKALLMTVLALYLSVRLFATAQVSDLLIYNGKTIFIFAEPLEQRSDIDSLRPMLFGENKVSVSTNCWRGYVAEWILIEDQLYLKSIRSNDTDFPLYADLVKLFGDKCIDGKVKAEWVDGNIISPQGKLLYYIHDGYASSYERELELQFENGRLKGTKLYDNSKSKQSEYSQNREKLMRFIYSNIKWDILPKQDTIIRVIVQYSANENGIIDEAKIVRGYNEVYNQEAIKVIKAIPEWDVYYRLGKLNRITWTLPVVFSEENKQKYKK